MKNIKISFIENESKIIYEDYYFNGIPVPESVAIFTPQAVSEYGHIHTTATITVPCGCCLTVSGTYVDGTEDDAAVTPTPSITVRRNASISVKRVA